METDSPVVYHGTSESRFPANENQRNQIKLSQEEIRILRECNKESFYFRCLPLAAASMAATYFAVRKGFLAPHPRYGPGLKMTGAAFFAWVLGKFSYRTTCEDKFLHLKNSAIGEAVRRKRGYILEKQEDEFGSYKSTDDISLKDDESTYYSDNDYHSSAGSLNLDVDKNVQYAGLDDRERPSTDRENQSPSAQTGPVKQFTSYEELRSRNREEYERHQPQQRKPDGISTQDSHRPWSSYDNSPSKRFNIDYPDGSSKNIYGDSWDNAKFS